VVFVTGLTGVGLRDEATGKSVWGKGKNLIQPHDRGHGMARSLTPHHAGPRLVPDGAILELRLFGVIRKKIHRPLVELLVADGYHFGNLEDPKPDSDFFLFSYDWRQDNVAAAAQLAEQLEQLRRVRGQDTLQVNLICQSNGAHICRYFTKYGALALEDAESGQPRAPAGLNVDKLILVGASNGGSIRALLELDRGRKYLDVIGRYWSPETLFTFVSLYQDLPVHTADLFVDENGRPMAVDLYDAEDWKRYQWSIYGRETSRQLGKDALPPWFGTAAEREEFLHRTLHQAHRFQRLLHRDTSDFGATRYYLIANIRSDTSSRAVLVQDKGVWQMRFDDDRSVRRNAEVRAAVISPGDGHATAESQRWLSPQEVRRLGQNLLEVEAPHRLIIQQKAAQQQILKILAEEAPPGP
jgi:hypothetical protein